MKFFISLILIAALSFAACLYLPWWMIAVAGFIVALVIPQGAGRSFLAGFLAVFLLWGGLSFWMSSANDHLLAHKISPLIIKTDNPILLIIITGVLGGIVAGFGALTGSFIRWRRKVKA